MHPVATWSRIVRMLDAQRGLSTADGARLYAQLYLTAADAIISVWDDKAFWSFWRPIRDGHCRGQGADVYAPLGRAQGNHQRARLVGHPLPRRGRAVCSPREAGRGVA